MTVDVIYGRFNLQTGDTFWIKLGEFQTLTVALSYDVVPATDTKHTKSKSEPLFEQRQPRADQDYDHFINVIHSAEQN